MAARPAIQRVTVHTAVAVRVGSLSEVARSVTVPVAAAPAAAAACT